MPFQPWHLDWLTLQASQLALSATLTRDYGASLARSGPSYSAFVGAEVIACAGIWEFWPGRAQVWSLMSGHMPMYRKSVHKAVKGFLDGYKIRRLECVVDPRHEAARRWAKRLGFTKVEGIMEAYTPGGDDQLLMVRIQ